MAGAGPIRAGRAFVELFADDSKLVRGLQSAQAKLRRFGKAATTMGRTLAATGIAAASPLALATRVYSGFEDQMKAVQAVTGATADEFRRLYDQAKLLGRTTSFTAGQVGGGQLSLARAGFSTAEIEAAIPGVLDLARATGTELAESADIAAGTLRAFALEAREMSRVSDVLVATANNSAQTLTDLGESMKYAAPIAQEYGLSVEQTAKALGVLANMQIKGTMAGTSLRQIMAQLASPAVQDQLRGIGVEALDASRNLRPVGDVLVDLGKAMAGMTNAQRIDIAKTLFDQRAFGAALKLAKTDFPALSAAIDNAGGVAKRTAAVMDSGLGGSFRRLMSAAEGVAIAVGESLASALDASNGRITDIAGRVTHWIEQNQKAVVVLGLLAVGTITAGTAIAALGLVIRGFAATIGAATMAVKGLHAALLFLSTHPAVAVIAAIGLVVGGLVALSAGSEDAAKSTELLAESHLRQARAAYEARDALAALAKQESLNAGQQQQAKDHIETLTKHYGNLGIAVDEATGKINGFNAAQGRMAEQDSRPDVEGMYEELRDLNKVWAESRSKKIDVAGGPRGGMTPGEIRDAWGTTDDPKGMYRDKNISQARKDAEAAEARIRKIEDMRRGLIQRIQQAEADLEPKPPKEPTVADRFRDMGRKLADAVKAGYDDYWKKNRDLLGNIDQLKIAAIDDPQQRERAAIEARYRTKRTDAKASGQDVRLVDQARRMELAALSAKYAKEEAEAKRLAADSERESLAAIQDRINATQARSDHYGDEDAMRRRLLMVEKEAAIREASSQAQQALIEKEYALREKVLDQEIMARQMRRTDDAAGRVEELEIDASGMSKAEKAAAKLAIQKRKALEEAETQVEKAMVEREYELKSQLVGRQESARGATAGTFSGYALSGLGGRGGPMERAAKATERSVQKLDEIERRLRDADTVVLARFGA